MSEENNTCKPDSIWPVGKKAAILTAIIAFGLGLFDFVDRQILASILPFLKEEWALTDSQCGMLVSAVNIAISVMVIPSAFFIDRWSRKKMLALASTIWSLATGLGAFTSSFVQLLCCRFTLGIGEAVYNPSAIPLLAASFPKKLRTTAVSLTQIGTSLGTPLGTVLGAYIASRYGWRHVFFIVMIPGLILAFLSLFIKDYKTPKDAKSSQSYLKVIREVLGIHSVRYVILCAICFYFYIGALINWLPTYFHRIGDIPITQASVYASMIFLCSIVCTIFSGPVIDFVKLYKSNGASLVMVFCLFCACACYFAGYTMAAPASMLQIALLAAGAGLGGFIVTGIYGCIVSVVQPGMSATAISLNIFSQNILGFAMGPLAAGILSDHFGLEKAMPILVFVLIIAGISMILCSFTYDRDVERAGCQDFHFDENA